MAEPTITMHPDSSLYGIKLATIVAGFAGGVVSLSFVRQLTKTQSVLSVFTGVVTAVYMTPILMHYFNFPPAVENGTAFVAGLTAMNVIPGVVKLSEMFKRNPGKFINRTGDDK